MSSNSSSIKPLGPSGFIELSGHLLVVDYGKIYFDGTPIGFLFEDGYLHKTSGLLGDATGLIPIEQIPQCTFRGIDTNGFELILPTANAGPTGNLFYNGIPFNVINGRVSNQEHLMVGQFSDDGQISIQDKQNNNILRKLDEFTQLYSTFSGKKSNNESWQYEFTRPLYRKDRRHFENEIIRYFENFDHLNSVQKRYVVSSLLLWAKCGLLQLVRKSEGNAALGNVKHGAAGVTGVRSGNVTLDKEEFEKEIVLSKRFGALAVLGTRNKSLFEVRLNQVVSHEYGHQLEFILSQATQDKLQTIFEGKLKRSQKLYPSSNKQEGNSELLTAQQVNKRLFISGYARSSVHEYWAECVAAFSIKESRDVLKELDPEAFEILYNLVSTPEKMVRTVHIDTIMNLQTSLRLGGELGDDLFIQ